MMCFEMSNDRIVRIRQRELLGPVTVELLGPVREDLGPLSSEPAVQWGMHDYRPVLMKKKVPCEEFAEFLAKIAEDDKYKGD